MALTHCNQICGIGELDGLFCCARIEVACQSGDVSAPHTRVFPYTLGYKGRIFTNMSLNYPLLNESIAIRLHILTLLAGF